MIAVTVTLGQIEVRLESGKEYPDCASDLTNRALQLMASAVQEVKLAGWSPFDVEIMEEEEADDA